MSFEVRIPRVYRFMQQSYVDRFWETGELMLSSFCRFSKHQDEMRQDGSEGSVYLVHRTSEGDGQTLVVEADFGHDAYVLCGSLLPSTDLMRGFGENSGIVIRDPESFGKAVASALTGYVRGFQGPCSYQSRRIVEQDLGFLNFGVDQDTKDHSLLDPQALSFALSNLINPDVYFLKHDHFVAQAEWRFVWIVDHPVKENLIIQIPNARKFCSPWHDQGEVIAFGDCRQ